MPPEKPRLVHVSPSAIPASQSSPLSTIPLPHWAGADAQTRLAGLPPLQLPTPEQQLVEAPQGAPAPSGMQLPEVGVGVGVLVAGGAVGVFVGVSVGAGGVGVFVAVGGGASLKFQSDHPIRS